LYPELSFDTSKFLKVPADNPLLEPRNQRVFFENYASDLRFDVLDVQKWYNISSQDVKKHKDGAIIVGYYGSFSQALVNLFPELQLDASKFQGARRGTWQDPQNRRAFFDKFAHEKGFNPFHVNSWYNVSVQEVTGVKGGENILSSYYDGSLPQALMNLYPELEFNTQKFKLSSRETWADPPIQRKFFDELADLKGFDPLNIGKWYQISSQDVLKKKGGFNIMKHHNGSFENALTTLYPELQFDQSKFKTKYNKKSLL